MFDADSQDDLDQEKIMNRIQETRYMSHTMMTSCVTLALLYSGTKSKVLDACEGKTRPVSCTCI